MWNGAQNGTHSVGESSSSASMSSQQDIEDDRMIAAMLSEEYAKLDGAVGRRLYSLASIPHVPRINTFIPDFNDASLDHRRLLQRSGEWGDHITLQAAADKIQLAEHEHELIEMNSNSEKLRQSYNELLEFKIVLQKVEKTVFVVFFSGEQARTKILKICEAFGANFYPVPEDITKQRQITREVSLRLADLEATLDAGIRHRNKALTSIGMHLVKWMNMVRREKAVCDTLNMLNFDVTKKCLVGEGWCPIFAKAQIQAALQRATFDSSPQVGIIFHTMDAVESPPTYFRTNKFTNAFQEIVDAYGVARYQEANPAVYIVITFPFLFAVIFGVWGHGICLLLGAFVLLARESKLSTQKIGSFMEMLFGGRYALLLMSLFSIYCGLIYNEFFSVPYHIFGGSAYKCRDTTCKLWLLRLIDTRAFQAALAL